jgi:hypothetical protein
MTGKPYSLRIAELITVEQLREQLYLDENFDGRWNTDEWARKNVGHSKGELAGAVAGVGQHNTTQYKQISYGVPREQTGGVHKRITLRVHQAVWALHHGRWPLAQIDHKDGNGLNNHPDNLREANHSDQNCNKTTQRNNTTGVTGVYYTPKNGCKNPWTGRVQKDRRYHNKGFATKADATEWVKNMRLALHGEFAKDNRELEATC